MMSKNETMCDLALWHFFFLKCHELEKTYEIEDECIQLGDITSRKPDYKLTREEYFNLTLIPKLYDKYLLDHPHLEEDFIKMENKRKEEELKKSQEEKIKEENNKKRDKVIALLKILVPCLGIGLGIALGLIYKNLVLGLSLAAGGILPSILLSVVITFKGIKLNHDDKTKTLDEYIKETKEYKVYLDNKKKDFINICNKKEEYIYQVRDELKKIKDCLLNKTNIPYKCINEEIIDGLLMLLLNNKADSLEDAMKLYVDNEPKVSGLEEKLAIVKSTLVEIKEYKELRDLKINKSMSIFDSLMKK